MKPSSSDTPFAAGFRMPPEWEEHERSWISFPFNDELWEGHLEHVREDVGRLIAFISRFEPVRVNIAEEGDSDVVLHAVEEHGGVAANVTFLRLPLDDAWFRDNGPLFIRDEAGRVAMTDWRSHAWAGQYEGRMHDDAPGRGGAGCRDSGPLFIRDEAGRVAMTDWRFNAWGEKYEWRMDNGAPGRVGLHLGMRRFEIPVVLEGGAIELNGDGVCLTTRSCLLSQRRNPNMDEESYEQVLHDYLGVSNVVWLQGGMQDDHTDGHIDTIVRFAGRDDVILCTVDEDESGPDYETLHNNLVALQNLRDHEGNPYEVVELPLPRRRIEMNGKLLPLTYANYYVGNGFVAVPVYEDENDERALEIIRRYFPDREVVGLPALGLITGGGAFHCITQQQPAGEVMTE